MYMSMLVTKFHIAAFQRSAAIILQAQHIQHQIPRGKVTIIQIADQVIKMVLPTKSSIQFLAPDLREPLVECACVILKNQYHLGMNTLIENIQPADLLEIIWYPDLQLTVQQLEQGHFSDSVAINIYRNRSLFKTVHILTIQTNDPHARFVNLMQRPLIQHLTRKPT